MKRRRAVEIAVALSLIAISDVPQTWAVLGEAAASVETDRRALAGTLRTFTAQRYSIQEITASDVTVREYVSGDTVFAVVWRGRRPPNLVSLLGAYFREYQEASTAAISNGPVRRGGIRVQAPHVAVETGGHARDIRGRAYLPALLPPEITAELLQ